MGWPKKKIDEQKIEIKKTELKIVDNQQKIIEKAEVDRLRKLLSEKFKDPKMAKKASLIIAEMLQEKMKK